MRGIGRSQADQAWLKRLGKHILQVIQKNGYSSVYDFWVNCAGDHISRASLNYIVSGKYDPKATTLRTLARLLKVKSSTLLDFE